MIRYLNKILSFTYAQQEFFLGNKLIRRSENVLPRFMIIGTPKAGTTSLFQYLAQHPKIRPPKEKELLYFSTNQFKGLKWYIKNFPIKTGDDCFSFEATPSYMYYKKSLKRIKHLFPDIKLIIILRDPVQRAFSQWNYNREGSSFLLGRPLALEKRTFRIAVEEELAGQKNCHPLHQYVYRSEYSRHLTNVYHFFSKNQVLVLDFEELKKQPQAVLAETTSFLGLENVYSQFNKSEQRLEGLLQTQDNENKKELKAYNSNPNKETLDQETAEMLMRYFEHFDKEIIKLTGRTFSWMESGNIN